MSIPNSKFQQLFQAHPHTPVHTLYKHVSLSMVRGYGLSVFRVLSVRPCECVSVLLRVCDLVFECDIT